MYGINEKLGSSLQSDLISIMRVEQQDKHKMRLMEKRETGKAQADRNQRVGSGKRLSQRGLVLRLAGIVLKF